ncbi:LysR family transcriptional regulator [Dechloromonas denitrificans]|uniref:LysR family transcriptional regulator n=1 Tax=Dechloromonas denitrificans TaxID=281362 RepID=UPI001CFC102B|nr:LysR family transcriptional regulator [Dechloromonas denitrificans]UCV09331.1 LysR family transcriptional regulator [Dechloromonas denitrificans]
MRITLRQIEVFAAIARSENVSCAARQLSMSQSAASSALVELERQFDCPLFDRIGKSLRLNSTGRGLLPQVQDMLARATDIEAYLAGGVLGPLAVGATLTIGNYLATLVVAEYLRRHPASKVSLHVANTHSIVEQLLRFELDIGLIEGEADDPNLLLEPWLDDTLVVFCAPQHPLASAGEVSRQLLSEQKWIVREHGSGTRALFDRVIAKALPDIDIQLELEHTEAIKRAVESGLGIGCLSRLSLREAFRRGSLVEIATPQFDLRRHFYFARHRQRPISPAARTFLELCRETSGTAQGTDTLQLPFIS